MTSSLTLIVAATVANGIGQSSRLPWRLPQEMKYFQAVTSSAPEGRINAVIMGRNTWESIPQKFRPLARRKNIVISRNKQYFESQSIDSQRPTVTLTESLSDAVRHVASSSLQSTDASSIHRAFVIGGASIYKESLAASQELADDTGTSSTPSSPSRPLVDRILLTRILSPAFEDCDVFMPEFRDTKAEDGQPLWERLTHQELEEWIGKEVQKGVQEENGVQYEFQMWVRRE